VLTTAHKHGGDRSQGPRSGPSEVRAHTGPDRGRFAPTGCVNGMEQSGLDTYDDDRPAVEAEAVADPATRDESVVDPRAATLPDATGEVTIAVTQVDYTIEEIGGEERPIVHVFGRRSGDRGRQQSEHVRVRGVEPYFYVRTGAIEGEPTSYDAVVDARTEGPNGEPFESIRGDHLTKIVAQTPRDVGRLRDEFGQTFEADILFPNRFLIDYGITSGVRVPARRADDGDALIVPADEVEPVDATTAPRIATIDIEVEDRNGFPEDGEEPIVCLTSHDSYDDELVAWLYDAPGGAEPAPEAIADHDLLDDGATVAVNTFESEEEMLDAFLTYIDRSDPDLLTGWNFEDFDAPYLLDRLERLDPRDDRDLSPDRLSRVGEVWRSSGGWGAPDVKGRVILDLLYAYQRTQLTELDSYRLDDVAERELGVGKERYPGDIGDLWEDDPERLLEYNVRDVELCVEIDRQQEIIPFWDEVRRFVGCRIQDAPTPGDAVDMFVLHKTYGSFALPTKGQQESEDFEGGAVFDPVTGVREMVTVLDLASLYPMSMVTMNASPETKVGPDYDGPTYTAPTGQRYRKEPDGIMREMVDELLEEREEKKRLRDEHDPGSEAYERYDRQQAAVKVIMNSLYGVSGWERFRLYDRENAAAVTATGRRVIEFTAEAARELGHEVTYGDTDSVMLALGGDVDKEAAVDASFDIEDHLNERYDDFARDVLNAEEHRFEIEFEKLYRRFFQAGKKKRYAGHVVWSEGKDVDDIDITGFEYKRSDIAPITKEVQRDVIEMIVTGVDLDEVKEYLHEVILEFRAGERSLDEVGIPGGIGKRLDNYDTDTAHVRGAKYANLLLGTNFARGSKPKRLYLEKVHPSFWERMEEERGLDPTQDQLYAEFKRDPDVICFEYADQVPDEFSVDWDEMLEKTLKGPIARVVEALGISWEEVRSGQEQSGLQSFM
jgi:DNA polymerase I